MHAGAGVAPPPPDPAVIVTFAGTPGLGKTELCMRLIPRLAARHVVVHHHSDALPPAARRGYWDKAAALSVTRRGDGRATVVLADKNLVDNPPGNWGTISSSLQASGTRKLAVFMTDAASAAQAVAEGAPAGDAPDSPFSMDQFALAMLRVGTRRNHVGKLDAKQPAALRILSAFGGTYRNRSPADVHATLSSLFEDVAVVPVTHATSTAAPLSAAKHTQLLELVREGFSEGRFGDGRGEALEDSWETCLRNLLQEKDVQDYLRGLACPLEEEVERIEAAVEASLAAAAHRAAPPAAEAAAAAAAAGAGAAGPPASATVAAPADPAAAAAAQAAQALAGAVLPAVAGPPAFGRNGRKGKGGSVASSQGGDFHGSGRASLSSSRSGRASSLNTRPQTPLQAPKGGGAEAATAAAAQAALAMAKVTVADGGAQPPKSSAPSRAPAAGAAGGSAAAAAAAAAAQAATAMGALPRPNPPAGGRTTNVAQERKLAKCVYACVANFDRAAILDAFHTAQRSAGFSPGDMQYAKPELHVTLWHKSSAHRDRGRVCIAADGEAVKFEIIGFDVSDRISAARVRRLDAAQQAAQQVPVDVLAQALDVQAPHITLWFARGVPPKEAGQLQGMAEAGNPSVKFLPLPQPLVMTGRVCLR